MGVKLATIRKILAGYEELGEGYVRVSELAKACRKKQGLSQTVFYRALNFLIKHDFAKEFRLYEERTCRDGRKRIIRTRLVKLNASMLRLLEHAPSSYNLEEKMEWAKSNAKLVHEYYIETAVDWIADRLITCGFRICLGEIHDLLLSTLPKNSFIIIREIEGLKSSKGKIINPAEIESPIQREVILNYIRWGLMHSKVCRRCFKNKIITFLKDGQCPVDEGHSLV